MLRSVVVEHEASGEQLGRLREGRLAVTLTLRSDGTRRSHGHPAVLPKASEEGYEEGAACGGGSRSRWKVARGCWSRGSSSSDVTLILELGRRQMVTASLV